MFGDFFQGKNVLVTGHTGFKGAWLCEWLLSQGSRVIGFSKDIPTRPSLFEQLRLAERLDDRRGEITDTETLTDLLNEVRPNCVFHLAAQPLVRLSYQRPVETFQTNVMGTVSVLEALRQCSSQNPETFGQVVAILITTDKCYENQGWVYGYRESDPMGGHDPYSASKGAAELVIQSYRRSFFSGASSRVLIASARAGNVIGGGDWATDRIVPDAIRSLRDKQPIPVRNPFATRPWQHVLEPLSGYLRLAKNITELSKSGGEKLLHELCSGFNFGPALDSNRCVRHLVEETLKHWPGTWIDTSDANAPHEARNLHLSIDKAHHLLAWRPVWAFEKTIAKTVQWYRDAQDDSADFQALTQAQILSYEQDAQLNAGVK